MYSKIAIATFGQILLSIASFGVVNAFVIPPNAYLSLSVQGKRTTSISPLGPKASNGLVYEDVLVGAGKKVQYGDSISIHYSGTFEDNGKIVEFENSRNAKVNKGMIGATEGMPIIFPIGKGKVIEGWEKGILGMVNEITPMSEGGKRQLTIPPELAYGIEGRGTIPSNKELTFEVELVSVNIKSESFISKFVLYGVPGVFGFLILNSIYLYATGQA